ncbi:Ankyrin repeat and KH domain-containing protein mask, partial [Gryllus bimaculatus]
MRAKALMVKVTARGPKGNCANGSDRDRENGYRPRFSGARPKGITSVHSNSATGTVSNSDTKREQVACWCLDVIERVSNRGFEIYTVRQIDSRKSTLNRSSPAPYICAYFLLLRCHHGPPRAVRGSGPSISVPPERLGGGGGGEEKLLRSALTFGRPARRPLSTRYARYARYAPGLPLPHTLAPLTWRSQAPAASCYRACGIIHAVLPPRAAVSSAIVTLSAAAQQPTYGRRTAVSYAAAHGSGPMLEALLSVPGLDANKADNEGNTPLHFAAQAGFADVVDALLTAGGAHVDARNQLGFTPLMKAALQGRTKCAKVLLQAGASP